MFELQSLAVLLAEEQRAPSIPGMMVFFIPMVVLFYFIVLRPAANERRRQDETLKNLKKNDRVITNSGIIGHFVSLSADNKEVTLKVDDNTRIKFLKSAIVGLYEEKKEEPAAQTKTS